LFVRILYHLNFVRGWGGAQERNDPNNVCPGE
jgi:hypothetical protein